MIVKVVVTISHYITQHLLFSLTVNSICSFWQHTSIWPVIPSPLRSKKPLDVWPWNFYQMSSSFRSHENRKDFDITWLVCKLQTKIPKISISRNATSRHANFTKFCRIVTIDVIETNPENSRSISQTLAILQNNL